MTHTNPHDGLEMHQMLCLSAAHVRPATRERLTDGDGLIVHVKGEWGWFLFVYDADEMPEACSEDLAAVIVYAREAGATWLMLDADGPTMADLPTYED